MYRPELPPWVCPKTAVIAAGVSNGAAGVYSYQVADLSPAGVVAFCSIIVPGIVGAIVYTVSKLYPLGRDFYFDFLERKAKIDATTLAGVVARLNARLDEESQARAATAQLAEIHAQAAIAAQQLAERNNKHVTTLKELVESLTAKVDEANAGIAHANERVEDANKKLHDAKNQASNAALAAELARIDLQRKLDAAQAELLAANRKLSDLTRQSAEIAVKVDEGNKGILGTTKIASHNSARLDAIEQAVAPTSGDNLLGPGSDDDFPANLPRSTDPSPPDAP
jgi:uncharacterized protein YyaL (SSP411 family)